jgi:GntR family transcriptional regulator
MPTYMYESVANDLREKIEDGTYPPGSKLPSRRELCQQHGVSEIVVARAMWILKHEGLVTSLPGSGMYVTSPAQEGLK